MGTDFGLISLRRNSGDPNGFQRNTVTAWLRQFVHVEKILVSRGCFFVVFCVFNPNSLSFFVQTAGRSYIMQKIASKFCSEPSFASIFWGKQVAKALGPTLR